MQKNKIINQAIEFSKGSPEQLVQNLFFAMTCVSTLTCIIRSDFNFAFGLLGYYMMKTANPKKMQRAVQTVSLLIFLTL